MAQKTSKSNTSDMTIDELSEAIDAHMESVDSASVKPRAKQSTMDEKVEAAIKKVAKTEVPTNEPTSKSSKIKVKKGGYITKVEEKPKFSMSPKEPDGRIATNKHDMKPIKSQPSSKKATGQTLPTPTKAPEPIKVKMVDVVVKTSKSSPQKDSSPALKQELSPISPVKDKPEAETSTDKKPPITSLEKNQDPVKEKTIVGTEPNSEPASLSKRGNAIDELSAQIVEKKKPEEKAIESDTLKTFDTKQYHIPIKPSHHHRAGSSFMVFAAVLAAILATVYVLNELEIIDLAALFYSN